MYVYASFLCASARKSAVCLDKCLERVLFEGRNQISGNVLQMKFAKSVFGTEKGMDAFISLAKTYFSLGGQQLSINVVSKEELFDAKKHPERHKDLVVRVGGYSDYFNNLEEGLKDNIIERTMLGL